MRPSSFYFHFHYLSQNENRFWVYLVFFSCSLNQKLNYTEVLLLFHACHNYEKGSECFYDSIVVLVKYQHNGIDPSSSSSCSLIYEDLYAMYYFLLFHTWHYYLRKWNPPRVSFKLFSNSLKIKRLPSDLASFHTC